MKFLRSVGSASFAILFACDVETPKSEEADSWVLVDTERPVWINAHGGVADTGTHHVRLRWSAAEDDSGRVLYRVSGPRPATVQSNELNIVGLEPGTSYVFRIEALDEAGNVADEDVSIDARTITECVVRLPSRARTITEATK